MPLSLPLIILHDHLDFNDSFTFRDFILIKIYSIKELYTKKGQLFVITNEETVEFDELLLMFITEQHVVLLTRVFIADFLPEYHFSLAEKHQRKSVCV